eukprot:COSAG03_NODE_898_length_5429_cov_1.947467_8_plen_41_part_01
MTMEAWSPVDNPGSPHTGMEGSLSLSLSLSLSRSRARARPR